MVYFKVLCSSTDSVLKGSLKDATVCFVYILVQSPRPRISAFGFFAHHLQYALLWVLENLLLYTEKSHKKEKAHKSAASPATI